MTTDDRLRQVLTRWRQDRHAELVRGMNERLIFPDAAVAGFVRHAMAASTGRPVIPPDSEILGVALDAIGSFPDLSRVRTRTAAGKITTPGT